MGSARSGKSRSTRSIRPSRRRIWVLLYPEAVYSYSLINVPNSELRAYALFNSGKIGISSAEKRGTPPWFGAFSEPKGARYLYTELLRLPSGFSRRTTVKPHLRSDESASFLFLESNAGFRRLRTSWRLFLPQNLRTPVPPMLNFPWTKGIRSLLERLSDKRVSGKRSGVWPSP